VSLPTLILIRSDRHFPASKTNNDSFPCPPEAHFRYLPPPDQDVISKFRLESHFVTSIPKKDGSSPDPSFALLIRPRTTGRLDVIKVVCLNMVIYSVGPAIVRAVRGILFKHFNIA